MEEVKHLPAEVKDDLFHLSVRLVPRAGFFGIEVVESDVGAEEVDSIMDGRRVVNSSMRF